jgi:lipopolysaccharide cholinephosphotransferase
MKYSIQKMQEIEKELMAITVSICDRNNITYYCQAGTVLGAVRHKGPIPWDYDADIIVPENEIDRFVECMIHELPPKYYVDYYKIDDKTLRQFPRIGLRGYSTNKLHLDVFRLIGLPNDESEQLKLIEEARYYTKSNALMRQPFWKLLLKGKFLFAFGKLGVGKYSRMYFIEEFNKLCNRYLYSTASFVMNPSGKYGKKNIFRKEVYGQGVIAEYEGLSVRIPDQTDFYLKQYYGDYMKYPPQEYIDSEMSKIFDIR